jgi:hypothetical protein
VAFENIEKISKALTADDPPIYEVGPEPLPGWIKDALEMNHRIKWYVSHFGSTYEGKRKIGDLVGFNEDGLIVRGHLSFCNYCDNGIPTQDELSDIDGRMWDEMCIEEFLRPKRGYQTAWEQQKHIRFSAKVRELLQHDGIEFIEPFVSPRRIQLFQRTVKIMKEDPCFPTDQVFD